MNNMPISSNIGVPLQYFPPKFGPTVSSLNGQETFLEDSSGQRWKVKVSILKNSFVLQEGWSAFASDHGLELGDFIIFNHMMGSHFEVHIYDKSACERLDVSGRRNQKEWTENNTQNFTTEDGRCLTKDKGSTSQHESSTSNFDAVEICEGQSKLKNDVGKAKMVTENNENGTRREKIVSKAECIQESNDMINRDLGKKQEEYRGTVVQLSNMELSKNNPGNQESNKITAGTKRKSMKMKQRESPNWPSGGCYKAYGVVKLETPDVDTHPSTIADNISCLMAANSEPYLGLPTPLPSSPVGTRKERKIVVLRDPDMRPWPVLYQEKSGSKTLMRGWEAFSKANNIQPGDECIFGVEGVDEDIFRVRIVRNKHVWHPPKFVVPS